MDVHSVGEARSRAFDGWSRQSSVGHGIAWQSRVRQGPSVAGRRSVEFKAILARRRRVRRGTAWLSEPRLSQGLSVAGTRWRAFRSFGKGVQALGLVRSGMVRTGADGPVPLSAKAAGGSLERSGLARQGCAC